MHLLTLSWTCGPFAEQRAVLTSNGGVAGQALLFASFVMTPLHVLDENGPRLVCLTDRCGNLTEVKLSGVVAVDRAWDAILHRVVGLGVSELSLGVASVHAAGADVDVYAITNAAAGIAPEGVRMVMLRSRIREMVRIDRHRFHSASGYEVSARNVRAILLAHDVPRGWSGAPVFLRGSWDLVGFVHGNASANHGAAVCLLPNDDSPVLNVLVNRSGAFQ